MGTHPIHPGYAGIPTFFPDHKDGIPVWRIGSFNDFHCFFRHLIYHLLPICIHPINLFCNGKSRFLIFRKKQVNGGISRIQSSGGIQSRGYHITNSIFIDLF